MMDATVKENIDKIRLSIVICTFNPDESIISRCLDAVYVASKWCEPLEIVVVDNNSTEHIANKHYISDFQKKINCVRIVREEKQGLTPARLKGIEETTGDLIVFIDDDNFIHSDFLLNAAKNSDEFPFIGAFSGQVILQFEENPPAWTRKYWGLLVYREFSGNLWSNMPNLSNTMPYGAGLIVRRDVANFYYHLHKAGKRNIQLDRTASSLFSAGDNDLAACACDIGLGVGIFDSLKLDHFITKERISEKYLVKLAEGIAQSSVIFRSFRGEVPNNLRFKTKMANKIRLLLKTRIDRAIYRAVLRGEKLGKAICENNKHS